MIDMLGAFFPIAQAIGGAFFTEKRAKKEYERAKKESRDLDRRRLVKETGDLTSDLTAQYLSSGLNPASLEPKIKGMYANIDKILQTTYGPEKPNKNYMGKNIAGRF